MRFLNVAFPKALGVVNPTFGPSAAPFQQKATKLAHGTRKPES
jgi:hypothetical protein